jgi:ferritin-like metal-binding protein YciE
MPEKQIEVVSQYVSDMHVLESHILKPLKRQVEQTSKEQPDVSRALQGYVTTTEQHIARLEARLAALGNQDGLADRAKQGVSVLFGLAASAIDMVRTHPFAKNLRDDYTAGSLAVVSYVMLRTTALACDDQESAQLAETHMNEVIEMLQWIARTIPAQVVRDLERERDVELKSGAANQVVSDPKLRVLYGSQPGDSAAQTIH